MIKYIRFGKNNNIWSVLVRFIPFRRRAWPCVPWACKKSCKSSRFASCQKCRTGRGRLEAQQYWQMSIQARPNFAFHRANVSLGLARRPTSSAGGQSWRKQCGRRISLSCHPSAAYPRIFSRSTPTSLLPAGDMQPGLPSHLRQSVPLLPQAFRSFPLNSPDLYIS